MNLIEVLRKSRSSSGGVLEELFQYIGRYQVRVNLNPRTSIGEDGVNRENTISIFENEPLPPRNEHDFGVYSDEHEVDRRLQTELQQNGIDGALVMLSNGILEIFVKIKS